VAIATYIFTNGKRDVPVENKRDVPVENVARETF
jgi:hypothetical protein